jgi:hypothetical protein
MQLQPQRVGLLNALPHIKLKPNIQVNINFMCDTYAEPFSKNRLNILLNILSKK